jgi:hypothetical protein
MYSVYFPHPLNALPTQLCDFSIALFVPLFSVGIRMVLVVDFQGGLLISGNLAYINR